MKRRLGQRGAQADPIAANAGEHQPPTKDTDAVMFGPQDLPCAKRAELNLRKQRQPSIQATL